MTPTTTNAAQCLPLAVKVKESITGSINGLQTMTPCGANPKAC